MKYFVPVNTPLFVGNEKKYLEECIDSGWVSSDGAFVKKFEDSFAKSVSRDIGIAVANGTAAIDIAIKALGISEGDEVIMPSFTIISCMRQILLSGAVPVFVDSNPDTWNMNVNEIERRITSKTKAIMMVHIYGLPVDVDPILRLAGKYNLRIIEDAAEMHGQTYNGRQCGSFGDISTFSFYANKHITTGEGGMIVTNDRLLSERCKSLRNLCFQEEKRFVHTELGWNYRMTNLQAAVGLAQLECLDQFITKKRLIGDFYRENIRFDEFFEFQTYKTEYSTNICWVFGIVLKSKCGFSVDEIRNSLSAKGVGTRPFFYPLHRQPVLRQFEHIKLDNDLPVSESLYEKGFYLPSGLGLTEKDMVHVVKSLTHVMEELVVK
jgi:perosamine synthetase